MVAALSGSQNVARQVITSLEQREGDINPMPWASFPNRDSYRKPTQCRQGLYNHAVNRLGEVAFKKQLKEFEKSRNR